MQDRKIKLKKRKPLFALALSLFLTGLGHLYNGKPRKGIIIFLIYSIIPFLFFQLSILGSGRMLIFFLLLSLLTSLGIYIWAAVDAWKQAKRIGENYSLKIYNKLYIYILLIILISFYPLGQIVDLSKACFIANPYRIITTSMAPTMIPGDLVMTDMRIDRAAQNYGLKEGELVVFKYPKDKTKHFVKRLIGLPGDKIEIKDLSMIVPEGYCFVIGDNRDNSMDSRHWGPIPLDDVVARAKVVYFSFDPKGGIRWGRIGKVLK